MNPKPIRLSKRAKALKPSATISLNSLAQELARQGKPVIRMVAGEPDFDTPEEIKAAASKALAQGFTKYTASAGIPELRKAIAEKLHRDHGGIYDPSQVAVTDGAKHAVYNLLQVLCQEGDEAIILSPYWVSYPDMVKLAGATPKIVPTNPKTFHLDVQKIEKKITKKTRVLILNSPNNPTGAVYSLEELSEVANLCLKKGIFIISDEIYEKMTYGRPFTSICALGEEVRNHSAVVNGCSKAFAMTGWRIGYCAGPASVIKAVADLSSQSTSNPNSIAQKAAAAAFSLDPKWLSDMVAEFDKRRKLITEGLNHLPEITCNEPEGAFYAFPRVDAWFGRKIGGISIENSADFTRACLEKANVAFAPGSAFGNDKHVRFSYATSRENITEAINRLATLLSASSKKKSKSAP